MNPDRRAPEAASSDQAIVWPVPCPVCGEGDVLPVARPGRTARCRNTAALPLPEDLVIPTCGACGEEWIDRATAQAIDAALEQAKRHS